MADRPSEFPEWASSPPTPPPTTITSPNTTQRQQGFQPGNPRRGFVNWLFNLIYRWITWLDGTTHRTSDLHPDHALPGGVLPTLGGGLLISAADFSARVYAGGYEVPLTSYPAAANVYTYSANSDTYWDLGRDGTWTPVVVAHGAGEPALTANSTRVYMVTTNATDRTARIDRRAPFLKLSKPFSTSMSAWLGLDQNTGGTINQNPPIQWSHGLGGEIYTLLEADTLSTHGIRKYHGANAFGAFGEVEVEAINAYWDHATSRWIRDAAVNAFALYKTATGTMFYCHPGASTANWVDTIGAAAWDEVWSSVAGGFSSSKSIASSVDVQAVRDLLAGRNLVATSNMQAGQDGIASRDLSAGRDALAVRDVVAARNTHGQRLIADLATETPAVIGATYQGNTRKAWGSVIRNNAGIVGTPQKFGCTITAVTVGGFKILHVLLDNPMTSAHYKVTGAFHLDQTAGPSSLGGAIFRSNILDASNFEIWCDSGGGFADVTFSGGVSFDVDGYN